jgi:putative membrane protein
MMGYGFGFGGMFMLVPIILVVIIVYSITRLKNNPSNGRCCNNNSSEDKALDILKERLARGEITEEEYTNKKNIISGK